MVVVLDVGQHFVVLPGRPVGFQSLGFHEAALRFGPMRHFQVGFALQAQQGRVFAPFLPGYVDESVCLGQIVGFECLLYELEG